MFDVQIGQREKNIYIHKYVALSMYLYTMKKLSEVSTAMTNEYRSFCLRIAIPCFLIIVTWIWKNNTLG